MNSDKRRKEGWKSLVDDLQRRNRDLEDILSSLQCNSSAKAMERLHQLREGQLSSFPDEDEEGPSESSATVSNNDFEHDSGETQSLSRSRQTRPPLLSGQSHAIGGSSYDTPSFGIGCDSPNASALPPEEVTRQATSSFFSCASVYFYVIPPDACEDLIAKIYGQSTVSSKSDFCQLCAIAMVGAKYCTDVIPDSVRQRYFQLATLLLQDTVEEDPLFALRACICLSVYMVLDKMTSARVMLGRLNQWLSTSFAKLMCSYRP